MTVVAWATARNAALQAGFGQVLAPVMAAIGTAESSLDTRALNNTPATGDYSVGVWQINYYGALHAERTRLFGTPAHLLGETVFGQARAAKTIFNAQGLGAWSTFTSGAYKAYLHGAKLAPGQETAPVDTAISPPTEDYSGVIRTAARHYETTAGVLTRHAGYLRRI